MNSGILTGRYAKAFFEYTKERHSEDVVYAQCRRLLSAIGQLPKLRAALMGSGMVSLNQKLDLLAAALSPDPLAPEIDSLMRLLERNRRSELLRGVLLEYLAQYREDRKLIMVQVTTAVPNLAIDPIIKRYLEKNIGREAIINHKVDPSIIGGFIYESWGYRADASVLSSLKKIKAGLMDKNKRMV